MRFKNSAILFAVLSAASFTGCGSRRKDTTSAATKTEIEQAFLDSSLESGVPVRLMMAAGYVESGLRAERSSIKYSIDGSQERLTLAKGESVFGFSMLELGLTGDRDTDFKGQIAAYGRLLKAQLITGQSPTAFVTSEEKLRWIWKFASVHMGEGASRNLLAVFAREMMATLNTGFSVQNSDGIIARLDAEPKSLRDEDLPENIKQDLTLDMYHADIRSAYLFSLVHERAAAEVNTPTRIEVIHCPFTLSTCIQMQGGAGDEANPLTAHYIIPSTAESVPGVLQFFHHNESVALIDINGKSEVVKDRVVIMLAGLSGRYSDGSRKFANPMWMTDYQLRLLGATIKDVCAAISHGDIALRDSCQSVKGAGGISFRTQPAASYRWADIPDYDETIFAPYLAGGDGILANTTLTLSPDGPVNAGTMFKLNAGFQATARRIELERLVRCPAPDSRVVWEPVEQRQLRNVTTRSFDGSWFDSGPNGTGDQFFRVKVNGEAGRFLGWSTKLVQLRNFDKSEVVETSSKYCLRNGT
jgi:hypothetical protein